MPIDAVPQARYIRFMTNEELQENAEQLSIRAARFACENYDSFTQYWRDAAAGFIAAESCDRKVYRLAIEYLDVMCHERVASWE